MLPDPQLAQALTALNADTFRATLYRAVRLEYLRTLTSTLGGWAVPNRYTRPQLSHALYLADAPDLAMLEASRQYQRQFITAEVPGYAIFPVRLRLRRVLDLTDPPVREALGTTLSELTGDWRTEHQQGEPVPTQRLGEAAFSAKFDALKYPSAYDGARFNTVVFTEHLQDRPDFVLDDVVRDLLTPDAS